jgi:hypothetical protein
LQAVERIASDQAEPVHAGVDHQFLDPAVDHFEVTHFEPAGGLPGCQPDQVTGLQGLQETEVGVAVPVDDPVAAACRTVSEDRPKCEVSSRISRQYYLPDAFPRNEKYRFGTGIRPGPGPGIRIAIQGLFPTPFYQPLRQFSLEWNPGSLQQ